MVGAVPPGAAAGAVAGAPVAPGEPSFTSQLLQWLRVYNEVKREAAAAGIDLGAVIGGFLRPQAPASAVVVHHVGPAGPLDPYNAALMVPPVAPPAGGVPAAVPPDAEKERARQEEARVLAEARKEVVGLIDGLTGEVLPYLLRDAAEFAAFGVGALSPALGAALEARKEPVGALIKGLTLEEAREIGREVVGKLNHTELNILKATIKEAARAAAEAGKQAGGGAG